MKYFSPDFLEFFKELAANNNKDWFDQNRKRYEREIREPFKAFVSDLIETVRANYEPELLIAPKDAIFRINRDIRFSKDKTPYKTNVSCLLSKKGRKNHSYPAFYLELGPENVGVYGGMYGGSTQDVLAMRTHIANNMKEFEKLTTEKAFLEYYSDGILGETQKRVPKELKEQAEEYPILFNKQYYYHAALAPEIIPTESLLPTLMEYYKASVKVKSFLKRPFD